MLHVLHVDEVDDDQAADVAEAELVDDLVGGLEVGGEDRLFERVRALPDELAGVDVDGGERLAAVDDEMSAALEVDFSLQGALDLGFDTELVEDRHVVLVEPQLPFEPGDVGVDEVFDAVERLLVVEDDFVEVGADEVTYGANDEVGLFVQQVRRLHSVVLLEDLAPELDEHVHVTPQLLVGDPFADGADDEAGAGRSGVFDDAAQALALFVGVDAFGDADVGDGRHEDDVASGQRDVAGEAGSLGADRLLGDLDEDLLAPFEGLLDRLTLFSAPAGHRRFAVLAALFVPLRDVVVEVVDVARVQEACSLVRDVDERRLHAGQDAQRLALVDVSDDPAVAGTFDVKLAENAVFHERDASFGARRVHDQCVGHVTSSPRRTSPTISPSFVVFADVSSLEKPRRRPGRPELLESQKFYGTAP